MTDTANSQTNGAGSPAQTTDGRPGEVVVVQNVEQPVAVVREVVAMDAMTEFFGRSFVLLAETLGQQSAEFVGRPFARYYGMPTDRVDVEAGMPVSEPVQASGSVQPSTLPAGRCYQSIHAGPYDQLVETYERVQQRMQADGVTPGPTMWEFYLNDPSEEPDPSKWLTQVCWPVAE